MSSPFSLLHSRVCRDSSHPAWPGILEQGTMTEKFLALRYFVWVFSGMLKLLKGVVLLWFLCQCMSFQAWDPALRSPWSTLRLLDGKEWSSGLSIAIYLHPYIWRHTCIRKRKSVSISLLTQVCHQGTRYLLSFSVWHWYTVRHKVKRRHLPKNQISLVTVLLLMHGRDIILGSKAICDPPTRNELQCAKPTFAVARNLLQGCENVYFEILVVTA